ncbi:putative bifunctional diguanylate cyclase/phosphodiesterase [Massilia sp. CMS3.1]|uniref:putative bifunctional diguanylate cyclase/phosphodiesterase n=1 Tax=Massilia sp. CMS3.1 TaxID=3373083 RepID=UPI003EE4A6FE
MNCLNDIAEWRNRSFTTLMSIVRVVALVVAIPSAAFGIVHGIPELALLATVALVWILVIGRLSNATYDVQVLNFLAMVFVVAIGAMILIGPLGLCYLMAVPVMGVILLGLQPALILLALGASCMLGLGMGGYCQLPVDNLESGSFWAAALFALTFACVGTFITLTCDTLIKGLSSSLKNVRTFATSLEERQESLHTLNDELRLTSAALAGLNEMVLITKVAERESAIQPIIFANSTFERCSGYRADEVIGRSMRMLHGSNTDPVVIARIAQAMARRESVSGELVLYTKSGEPCWIEMDIVPFASKGKNITHWVTVGRDITERRRSADAIHQLAFFDVLTGLPNRRLLMERLEIMVAGVNAGKELGAVLYIDLDNFKHVNDARGHATGDALLKHIAACLVRAVHEHDTVARLGGDEFVVLLENLGRDSSIAIAAAQSAAERVRGALTQGADIDGQMYHSSGSIGIAIPTRPDHTVHDLLREADTAMYQAKGSGRNGVALFETIMLADAENTLSLERDLLNALNNGELALHFQLQVDHDGKAIGAEVLLRWRRADGTLVPPDVFIPVAEATGLIVSLGTWVLRQSCLAWLELEQAGVTLPLSINVSPRQFRQPDFVAVVRRVVLDTGVPPQQLIFEVTEGLMMDDSDEIVARMSELAQFGIRFSIDDFGTGYSNLAYLRKMPLFELKIDKSFMRDMPHDINGMAIVQSILSMAGHLDLRVVAEGIENGEQAQFLKENGAPFMQGFLFCRPMPLVELIKRLTAAESIKEVVQAP